MSASPLGYVEKGLRFVCDILGIVDNIEDIVNAIGGAPEAVFDGISEGLGEIGDFFGVSSSIKNSTH